MFDPIELLKRLVALPSVNPMGRGNLDDAVVFEGRVTAFLEDFFRSLGVAVDRVPVSPGRDNLIARYEGSAGRRTLLFDAHQDTVPTDGMIIPPFEPTVRDGRLYGRGSCDVKGSMAAMLAAFARLVKERPDRSASVVFACTVDEEYTHTGSSRLAADRPKVDLAIVAEPTRLNLVTTHKGAVRWKIQARGVACHSATPQLGDNAIYRMARVVAALEAQARELRDETADPVLGLPSMSVGVIEGGQSPNIVPDSCVIQIDRRILPREDPASVRAEVIERLSRRLSPDDFGHLEFMAPWVNMPALRANVSSEWLSAITGAIKSATGRTPETGGVPYGTDAGPLSQAGIPCVVLGPGDIAQAHTRDEWIEIDQVRAAAEVYYRIARDFE